LVAELEEATALKFEILQGKEKFGRLRIHLNHANDAIRQRLEAAREESLRHCEICGQPAEWREGDWIKTRCDEHPGAQGAREHGRAITRATLDISRQKLRDWQTKKAAFAAFSSKG